MKAKKPKQQVFRVWIAQVNQCCVDVVATDREDAKDKARRQWRKEEAIPYVLDVAERGET